ncbi:MAG: sodium:proton antiporter, partial [Flavobacteriales bacterium]|nr:sodium:proton antiporter [Flavobacteriales bacterium]
MFALIAILFVAGYTAIALEHPLKVNKAASALLTGMVLWAVITVGHVGVESVLVPGWADEQALSRSFAEHLSGIASILFFLLGAMVVVELMDAHAAFQVITDRITTTDKRTLLWVVGLVTFFLSAALDNLTT